jgi:nucleolar protein 9
MDRVLAGLVSEKGRQRFFWLFVNDGVRIISKFTAECISSPYVSGLFVDPTSSHLSESILAHCSSGVFVRLWDLYFADNLSRLAVHPVANFVVARGVERLDAETLEITISRLHATWSKARSRFITVMITPT